MSGSGPPSEGRLPLEEWLTRYDDALLRGTTPPDLADVSGPDAERLRDFLDMLDRTLRPKGSETLTFTPSSLDPDDEEGATRPFETIGRFLIEKELGRGGFGIVFRAFDPTIGRRIALKVPRADALTEPDVRRRFLREAHAAAQLDHPNLVPVFEVGEAGHVCYIASAYCEGPTLRRWIEDGLAPAEPNAGARLTLGLARAVEHMHARGLLHCDLKPGNVLLDLSSEPGGEPTPRVTDFGLARLADAPVGESTAARAWGTPPYMAPEQIEMRREAIGPATDVYALGAVLYELLTGIPPHRGETAWELMRAVVAEPPAPPRHLRRSIPRDLDAIAMRCLEKRPDRRYPDAAALAEDLTRFLERLPTLARPLGRIRRLVRWSSRNPAAAASLVLGAAMLAASAGYVVSLRRIVADLNRANAETRVARDRAEEQGILALKAQTRAEAKAAEERGANYAAVLVLAQQELARGQSIPAQRLLRGLIPKPGTNETDRRDFAWYYLWLQSRRECTLLDELALGNLTALAAGNGTLLAAAWFHGDAQWRVDRPELVNFLAPIRPTFRFEGPIAIPRRCLRLAILSGGKTVIGYSEEGGKRRISSFDLPSGAIGVEIDRSRLADSLIAESANGSRLIIGIGPARTRVLTNMGWGLGERGARVLGVPEGYEVAVSSINRVVSLRRVGPTAYHRTLEFWNMSTGRRIVVHPEPLSPALAASHATGGAIATGTLEGVVQIREPNKGAILSTLPAPQRDRDRVACLAFSRDGKTLAAGYNGLVILWDFENRREIGRIAGLPSWTSLIAFLDDAARDVAIGLNTGEIIVWHLDPIEPALVLDAHGDEVWGAAYLGDGKTLASLGGDKLLKVWDVASGAESAALAGHEAWPSCLAADRSGGVVASGDYGGEVLVWDVEGRKLRHRLKGHEGRLRAVAITRDGRWVASGGRDRKVCLWDTSTGILAATFNGHEGAVRGLAFRPDGTVLASAGEGGDIVIWDVESRRESFRLDASSDISSVVWSADGRTLAVGDNGGGVVLWDAVTKEMRARLPNLHQREVSGLAFSPDGSVLAVGGQDKLITLVDVATGRRHLTLAGHEGGVNALSFSPDGFTLASASHDKTVRLWWAGPAPVPASTLP